ncbi:sulfhydryl oxidase [Cetacean poxvirus 1]|nr:sulfhydryl oxidase [Cetacean poxvirus 1]
MEPKHWGRSMWTIIFITISNTKYDRDVELCKKRLYHVISALPCTVCRQHAKEAMEENNVMSSVDLNYIYYFFIKLFNNLVTDERYMIDLTKVCPLV